MATDFNKPVTTDNYADILETLRDNINTAQTLLDDLTGVSNIPTGAIKFESTANKFQRFNGSTFDDIVISKAGGGTGTATPFEPTRTVYNPDVTNGGTTVTFYYTRDCYEYDLTDKISGVQYNLVFQANATGALSITTESTIKPGTQVALFATAQIGTSYYNLQAFHSGSEFALFNPATGTYVTVTNGDFVSVSITGTFVSA